MAAPLFTSSDALLRLLDIGQDDIHANRRGVLGPRQRAASRHTLVRTAIGCLVVGVLALGGGLVSRGNDGQVLVPWITAAAALALAVVAAVAAWRGSAVGVTCVSGRVEVIAVPFGRGHTAGLQVGDEQFLLPPRMRSTIADWTQAIDPAATYLVYVTGVSASGARPNAVGIEPA